MVISIRDISCMEAHAKMATNDRIQHDLITFKLYIFKQSLNNVYFQTIIK